MFLDETIDNLQNIYKNGANTEETDRLCKEIAHHFLELVEKTTFYQFPFDLISQICKYFYGENEYDGLKCQYTDDEIVNSSTKLLKTMCENDIKETALLLNYINLPTPNVSHSISIIGSLTSSLLCTGLYKQYQQENECPDIDWEFVVEEKEHEMCSLKEQLINLQKFAPKEPEQFSCSLYEICRDGDLESLKSYIYTHNSDLNYRDGDKKQRTPLHIAAAYGQYEIVDFLLEKGADMKLMNFDGDMPIHEASKNGRISIVKLL